MSYFRTISIRRTKTEWDLLEQKVSDEKIKDLSKLIRNAIATFIKEHEECPDCRCKAKGKRTERRPQILNSQVTELKKISEDMGMRVSTLVDRLIIEPMLNDK